MAPDAGPPVLGRPSPAAGSAARLRPAADPARAAYRCDGGDAGPWSLRAASVAGVRHRLAGEDVQDSYAWALAGDRLVAAVADGVGGLPGSAGAAAASAVAACRGAAASLADGSALSAALADAVGAANRAAAAAAGATTLVVVVAAPDGGCVLGRVGDSTALVLDRATRSWRDLFGPADDDIAATVTDALPSDDPPLEEVEPGLEPGSALVLLTDGVAGPIRDGPGTVAPALADGLVDPPAPLALATLLDFSRQGCHDDRTLVGIWWSPGAGPGEGP